MGRAQELIAELREPTRSLRHAAPDVFQAFGTLHDAALRDGALSSATKELLALVIAVVKECDGCIAYHARAAAMRGATPEQVAEALSVAILMDGGTATTWGPKAWEAYHEFAGERAAAGVA
jgi:AhpD family alkylhydroperoxidase